MKGEHHRQRVREPPFYSTVSSGVNSLVAVVWEDFLKSSLEKRLSQAAQTRVNKALGKQASTPDRLPSLDVDAALVIGLSSIGIACMAKYLGGVLQASMTVLSMLGGSLAGLFLFGMVWPWANRVGALAGVSASALIMGWICIGAQIIKPYRTSLPRSVANCSAAVLGAAGFLTPNGTFTDEFLALRDNDTSIIGHDLQL